MKKCNFCGGTEHDPEMADIRDGICDECAYEAQCVDQFDQMMAAVEQAWLDGQMDG